MPLPIYIPSRSRFNTLDNCVLQRIPRSRWRDVTIVTSQNQADSYKLTLKALKYPDIKVINCSASNIAEKRYFIGQYALTQDQPVFCMVDDDVTSFAVRKGPDDWHLKPATEQDMNEMFDWLWKATMVEYAQAGISARGNNLVRTKEGYWVGAKPLVAENVRIFRLSAFRTTPFLSVEHCRVPVMEDFDVSLQLLRMGFKNVQSYWWTQDQRQSALPGGCSDFRTLALHEEAARTLAALHPGFVSLRTKANKSKVTHNQEFSTRTETTIAWKRAFDSYQGNRRSPR